jgi:hypothetical protein
MYLWEWGLGFGVMLHNRFMALKAGQKQEIGFVLVCNNKANSCEA